MDKTMDLPRNKAKALAKKLANIASVSSYARINNL